MKKLLLVGSAVAAMGMLISGCTSVGARTEWKETRALRENYEVVASRASGEASSHEIWFIFFPVFVWGDNSFDTARIKAVQRVPGSDDLINISADISLFDAVFYKKHSVVLNGAAIKYTSDGKSEKLK